jgi:hypothetical protein
VTALWIVSIKNKSIQFSSVEKATVAKSRGGNFLGKAGAWLK